MRFFDLDRMGCLIAATAIFAIGPTAYADDLGVIGPVYEIAEKDLLTVITATLRTKEANGTLAALNRNAQMRAQRQIDTPSPVRGLSPTLRATTWYFDPTIVMPNAIADDQGRILVAAGTRVNPLTSISLTQQLLFFDARDTKQVKLARRLINASRAHIKPILTGGPPLRLMKSWKLRVYFDQGGALTRRFGLRHVPSLLSQDGLRIRIDEIPTS